jgi:hypothetical protein
MRHGRAFREKEDAFSRDARLRIPEMADNPPRDYILHPGVDDAVDIVRQLSRMKWRTELRLGVLRIDGAEGPHKQKTAQLKGCAVQKPGWIEDSATPSAS